MDSARIAALLAPFLGGSSLSEIQLSQISTYIDLLIRWNARINLTSIRDPEEIVTRHLGESFFCARHLFPNPSLQTLSSRAERDLPLAEGQEESRDLLSASTTTPAPGSSSRPAAANSQLGTRTSVLKLADLGSGAGFPGLPIQLWAPSVHVTLIESNHKKATFLREVIRAIRSTDIDVFAGRAEGLLPGREEKGEQAPFDVVTLRAVERFDQALPLAARLTRQRLALLIGEEQCARVPALAPGFVCSDPLPIPASRHRVLLLGQIVK